MKLVKPSYEILSIMSSDYFDDAPLQLIELAGRTCYKSENKISENSARDFIAKILKRGHESVIEHSAMTVKFICDRGCCYDKETRVLTENGWKFFKDLNPKDVFYSLEDKNNLIKLEATKIIKKKFKGELDYYSSSQINLQVTPNHNMWVFDYDKRSEKTRGWKFLKSEDLINNRYVFNKGSNPINTKHFSTILIPSIEIPRGFYVQTLPDIHFDSILLFELLGWWLSDGNISLGKKGSGNRLVISQVKSEGRNRVEYLLSKLDIDFWKNSKEYRIKCPQLLRWIFNNFIKDKNVKKSYYAYIPKWFFTHVSPKLLKSFLKGVIGGDGSKHTKGQGYQIYTASRQLAEDLVHLCLLCGKVANIYEVPERTREFPNQPISICKKQFVVSMITTKTPLFDVGRSAKKEKVFYDDFVYCVELPKYHKLYVMREGKPCWCGNSHELVRHRLCSFSQESTRFVDYKNECTFVIPPWLDIKEGNYSFTNKTRSDSLDEGSLAWFHAMIYAESCYLSLVDNNWTPQQARSVLPNSTKAEIIMTTNFREWRHIFKLRCSKAAHPQMREIMLPLLKECQERIPIIFDDIGGN